QTAAGTRTGAAGQPRGTWTEAGIAVVQQRGGLRRRLQLPDVPRSRAPAEGVHRTRRARRRRCEPVISRTDTERRRYARLGLVLPGSRRTTRAGAALVTTRRREHRIQLRRRAEPRVL